jgi:glucose/arabinose dehydrogenase
MGYRSIPRLLYVIPFLLASIFLLHRGRLLTAQAVSDEAELRPGFVQEIAVKALDGPTAFAIAPDGRIYITQKAGAVRVFADGKLLRDNFIDLSNEVNQAFDRGLVGVTLHPDFPRTPFVYFSYAFEPPEARGHKQNGARLSRLIRVTADPSNLNKALPDSTLVILGAGGTFAAIGNPDRSDSPPLSCQTANGLSLRDCIPVEGTAHQVNMVRFGRDGALYAGVGDGGDHPDASLRAQNLDSLSGKILRINPLTGAGLPDNPFYNGDPNANRSKVFMLGLRNPFRLAFDPTAGLLVIGEVGKARWEEVNRGSRGDNFGWPCFEGEEPAVTTPPCDRVQASPVRMRFPVHRFDQTHGRVAVIGGDFYTGMSFPADYRNAYFFGEYNTGEIWFMRMVNGAAEVRWFARKLSGVVQISTGPDGHLYLLSIRAGTLYRIRYTGS